MIASYHNHTYRCRHATGTEEEYVQQAIAAGIRRFGFSDHTPQLFPGQYYSTMRMYPHELAGYVETVLQLQKQYADQIDIILGVETEFYPVCFKEVVQMARDHGITYMLLGQHWIGNEEAEPYSGRQTADVRQLERYCDQTIEGMQTGLFTYLAHPDLLWFVGEDAPYRRHMRRICQEAKACNMPLEINLNGIYQKRNYPDTRFWEMAAEEGNSVVIGVDAHSPEMVSGLGFEKDALELARRYGLPVLETVELRKI